MVCCLPLIEALNLTKIYKVRKTVLGSGRSSSILARILFGESFTGRIVYRELKALDNVSFRVDRGSMAGLIGLNGSGKTTLLKVVSGLVLQDGGVIRVLGEELPERRSLHVTPIIEVNLNPYLTGRQNLEYLAAFFDIGREELVSRVRNASSIMEIEDRADDRVLRYSSGMVAD